MNYGLHNIWLVNAGILGWGWQCWQLIWFCGCLKLVASEFHQNPCSNRTKNMMNSLQPSLFQFCSQNWVLFIMSISQGWVKSIRPSDTLVFSSFPQILSNSAAWALLKGFLPDASVQMLYFMSNLWPISWQHWHGTQQGLFSVYITNIQYCQQFYRQNVFRTIKCCAAQEVCPNPTASS